LLPSPSSRFSLQFVHRITFHTHSRTVILIIFLVEKKINIAVSQSNVFLKTVTQNQIWEMTWAVVTWTKYELIRIRFHFCTKMIYFHYKIRCNRLKAEFTMLKQSVTPTELSWCSNNNKESNTLFPR
jgi:hypothetical protein